MSTEISSEVAYLKLKGRFHMISALGGAGSILYMDSMTAMKPGSDPDRSEQMMALAKAGHKFMVAPEVSDWLDAAEEGKDAMTWQDRVNLSLMRRNWVMSTALPEALVAEKARLETEGNNLHTKYRDSGNWKVMRPVYEEAFKVSREVGIILKDRMGFGSVYEALLDQFSPGLRLATVEREFAVLEGALPSLVEQVVERQGRMALPVPMGEESIAKQKKLNEEIVRRLGFDRNRGVFYSGNMHPVSGGTPDDSRMTTRYMKDDFLDGLATTVHETGHSLYEQGTPKEWRYQPAGHTMGMDIHESQSMIIQYQACMAKEFIGFLSAEATRVFNRKDDPTLSMENLAANMYHVKPSFIRVSADELSYPSHIILRYNLERALVEGNLNMDDMPAAWNDGMKKTFGIVPPDPSKGHMQDVHWPVLSIGYFPAYTLGAMGAAQFFAAATKAHPEIRDELKQGRFDTLRGWLRTNVHEKGSLLTQDQLFTEATGEPLNAKYYLNHLRQRYLP